MDFICKCGKRQRQKTPLKHFTEKDVEAVGWRKINGEWVCPICCNNKAALNEISNDLNCVGCLEGMEALMKREQESLEKYGWFTHMIMDAPDFPYGTNVHTHGLPEHFDHPNLQICIPVDPRVVHGIIAVIIERIKQGKEFPVHESVTDDDVINGYPFMLVWAKESDREVLRVILSDKDKNLDRDTMELNEQWEGTFEKSEE